MQQSPYIQWLAVSSLSLGVVLALLQMLVSLVLSQQFTSQVELSNFLGLLNLFGGLGAFLLQLFVINRLIARIGVGNASLIYPAMTWANALILALAPIGSAVSGFSVLVRGLFRLTFRAPVLGLIYNTLPLRYKGRARAFVNGLIEPIGLIVGAVVLYALISNATLNLQTLAWITAATALIPMTAMWQVTRLYGATLVQTLEGGDSGALLLNDDPLPSPNPQLLASLTRLLDERPQPEFKAFMAKVLAEIAPQQAPNILAPYVRNLNLENSARLSILDTFLTADLRGETARALYVDMLFDGDHRIRQSALLGLEHLSPPNDTHFNRIVSAMMLNEPEADVRAQTIELVAKRGEERTQKAAHTALLKMLQHRQSNFRRAGVRALAAFPLEKDALTALAKQEREAMEQKAMTHRASGLISTLHGTDAILKRAIAAAKAQSTNLHPAAELTQALHDNDDSVRTAALITLAAQPQVFEESAAFQYLVPLLQDPTPRIRSLAAMVVGRFPALSKYLLPLLADVLDVRETVIDIFKHNHALALLEAQYPSAAEPLQKMIAVAMARLDGRKHHHLLEQHIDANLNEGQLYHAARATLAAYREARTVNLVMAFLYDRNLHLREEIFYFLTTLTNAADSIQAIESILNDPRELAANRANAIEALEALTSPSLTKRIVADPEATLQLEHIRTQTPAEAVEWLLRHPDAWLRAATVLALPDLHLIFAPKTFEQRLNEALADELAVVRDAARAMQRRLQKQPTKEVGMLSLIEKMVILKQVKMFETLPMELLKALANSCQEEIFEEAQTIFQQNTRGNTMYVIVSGGVDIRYKNASSEIRTLANVGEYGYFGEMSLYNNRPRSAAAVATARTLVLNLNREALVRLVRQHPEISLTLIDVLSQRLADANARLADDAEPTPPAR
jgi:HEAT repeat protein